MRPEQSRRLIREAALAAAWILAALAVAWWGFQAYLGHVFEDSYITFRYAQNLAQGNGFTFNPGERIFGTTTPLWTLLLAVGAYLGGDIVILANAVGWLCLVATGLMGALILTRAGQPAFGAVFALLVWGGLGRTFSMITMETPLLQLLSMVAIAAVQGRIRWIPGAALGLAMLVRYDAAILAAPVLAAMWIRDRAVPWREGVIAAAMVLPWLVFATVYFGSAIPHTLGAKIGSVETSVYFLESGWRVARDAASPLAYLSLPTTPLAGFILLGLLVVAGLSGAVRSGLRRDLALPLILFATPWLWWCCYALIGPPPAHRWHLLPGLFVLVLSSLWLFSAWSKRRRPDAPWAPTIATIVLASFLWRAHPAIFEQGVRAQSTDFYLGRVSGYADIARWLLKQDMEPAQQSLFVREPGYLAYQTNIRVIDGAGLVSRDIYFHNHQRKTELRDILESRAPDFVILSSRRRLPAAPAGYVALLQAGDRVLFGLADLAATHGWKFHRIADRPAVTPQFTLRHPVRFDQLDKIPVPRAGVISPAITFDFDAVWAPWVDEALPPEQLVALTPEQLTLNAGGLMQSHGIAGFSQGSLILVRPWQGQVGYWRLTHKRPLPAFVASARFSNPMIISTDDLTGLEPDDTSCVQIESEMNAPYQAFVDRYASECRSDRRWGSVHIGARYLAMLVRGTGHVQLIVDRGDSRVFRSTGPDVTTLVWDVRELRGRHAQLAIQSSQLIQVAEMVLFDDLIVATP